MKKIVALSLVLVILASALCGCKEEEKTGDNVNISVMMSLTENGGTETKIIDTMFEMAGVNGELIQAPSASYREKLNATLASGKLPDIVYLDEVSMNAWIEEGALLPLDDILEECAPNFLKNIEDGDMKELINPDDNKVYGLPYILRLPAQSTMGIRRDWLNKLNLQTPETIEDLEKVLVAFRDNAAALGTTTIIPYAGSLSALYSMYGIQMSGEQEMWTLDKNNNYITRYEHENYRQCLEMLSRFYKEKLIDPEYLTRNADNSAIYNLFNAGTAGTGFVYSTRLREISEILQNTDKNALFDFMPPITGIDGEKQIMGRKIFGTRGCITIAAEDKVKDCLRFLDWAYSEEGERLMNYGIEGTHYDMVDGKPVIKDEFNHGWVEIRKEGIVPTNMSYNRSLDAYNQCMFYGKDIEELDAFEKLTYKAYYENEPFVIKPLRAFSTATGESKGTDIYARLNEIEAKAITGKISVDDFFAELSKIKKDGLDDITKEMQEYWDKINK